MATSLQTLEVPIISVKYIPSLPPLKSSSFGMAPRLFVADDKFPDVIAQLQARGWTRFPHDKFPKFDLRWTNYAKIAWTRVRDHQIVNHLHNAIVLSKKNELAKLLYGLPRDENVDAFYPRTVNLAEPGAAEKVAALFLYARAVGVILAWNEKSSSSESTKPLSQTATALAFLKRILHVGNFFELSSTSVNLASLDVWSKQWDSLRYNLESEEVVQFSNQEIRSIIHQLREKDEQIDCIAPGHGNLWICKPSNLSQGRGIHLLKDFGDLLALAQQREIQDRLHVSGSSSEHTETAWVVQKYIERPLLLGNRDRKFDVRQWVLVTELEPLTVYWYEDCYLRFCSRSFSLQSNTLEDGFTHLSNFSIQKNALREDGTELMWHSNQIQELLRNQHGQDVWVEKLVPQMQHVALRAIQAARPRMKQLGHGFEWLGFDFLIDDALAVWLLEVNVSPDVSHSTDVTATLVPEATQGVLDLVVGIEKPSQANPSKWIKIPAI